MPDEPPFVDDILDDGVDEIQKTAASPDAVKAFIASKGASTQPGKPPEKPPSEPDTPGEKEVAPDESFLADPVADVYFDTLKASRNVEVTPEEMESFLLHLWEDDSPWSTIIPMFNGKLKIEVKVRTQAEQNLILRTLEAIEKERRNEDRPYPPIESTSDYQNFCAACMVLKVNGRSFCELPGNLAEATTEVAVTTLRAVVKRDIVNLPIPRWNAILQAMSAFESKCAKLSTEALNEGFWKTRA